MIELLVSLSWRTAHSNPIIVFPRCLLLTVEVLLVMVVMLLLLLPLSLLVSLWRWKRASFGSIVRCPMREPSQTSPQRLGDSGRLGDRHRNIPVAGHELTQPWLHSTVIPQAQACQTFVVVMATQRNIGPMVRARLDGRLVILCCPPWAQQKAQQLAAVLFGEMLTTLRPGTGCLRPTQYNYCWSQWFPASSLAMRV